MNGMGDAMNSGDRRALLEQRAEAVRSRLERRLDALDERRDRVLALAQRATQPPVNVILIGTASLVGVAYLVHRLRQAPSRRRRVSSFSRGPARQRDGFLKKALKRAALSFVATLAQRLSTRGLDQLLPEAPPPRRALEVPRPRGY
jgi:hypothetical protein